MIVRDDQNQKLYWKTPNPPEKKQFPTHLYFVQSRSVKAGYSLKILEMRHFNNGGR